MNHPTIIPMDTDTPEKEASAVLTTADTGKGAKPAKVSKDSPNAREHAEHVPMTFPQRLMEILSEEECADVISWLPHGKAFIINKKKKFAADILPRYFKQSKFTSFTRKLNRWGFTRVTRGHESGAYFHQYFQRGDPRLCLQMTCQSLKLPEECEPTEQLQLPLVAQLGLPVNNCMFSSGISSQAQAIGANNCLLQLQQMQIQQLKQRQQMQAADLIRRAMSAQRMPFGGQDLERLYLQQMLNNKVSTMTAQPYMMAVQNGIRGAGFSPMTQVLGGSVRTLPNGKSGVRRASAA